MSFGNVSGMVPDINARVLNQKGSLFFTRPGLVTYTRTPQLLQETADDLFDALSTGIVKMAPPRRFELAQAAEAQRALEAREITGTAVLIC